MMENLWPHVRLEEMRRKLPTLTECVVAQKREEKMRRNEKIGEMRNEKNERKAKRKE